ncbi:unnamed protein product [Scytosiphon promiscuus]
MEHPLLLLIVVLGIFALMFAVADTVLSQHTSYFLPRTHHARLTRTSGSGGGMNEKQNESC